MFEEQFFVWPIKFCKNLRNSWKLVPAKISTPKVVNGKKWFVANSDKEDALQDLQLVDL